jgi:acyl-CoA synthetase (AMP-forming)/AMP-acid ligase II
MLRLSTALAGNRVITACYTGDIGHFDEDGFVFITDRKKDVVFVKGFDVFPREVEEVIHTHPKVGTVGVVGVPDARTGGERLVAFVVPRTGKIVDPAELSAYCASRWSTTSPERGAGGRAAADYGRSQAGPRRTAAGSPRRAGTAGRLSSHGPIKRE